MPAKITTDKSIGNQNLVAFISTVEKIISKPHRPFSNFRDLLEKIRALHFFHSSRPLDIVRKQMGEDRLRDRDRKTAEEKEAAMT